MSLNVKEVLENQILFFQSIDSTNNYAASLIDADKAQNGITIVAQRQTAGKGQRGNSWKDQKDASLLMSLIIQPQATLDQQFLFLATVATTVVKVLKPLLPETAIYIKYPNDIIINDKKAGGILIENTIKGNTWAYAIIGIGINVLQTAFDQLSHAGSLYLASAKSLDINNDLLYPIRTALLQNCVKGLNRQELVEYNELLYKKGQYQLLNIDGQVLEVKISSVDDLGALIVEHNDGTKQQLIHGSFTWLWP